MMASVLEVLVMLMINHAQECTAPCGRGYSWKCPTSPGVRTIGGVIGIILGVFAVAGIFIGVVLYCACVGRRLPKCCKKSENSREVQLTYPPYGQSPHQVDQREYRPANYDNFQVKQ